jgi:SAM-dependent methyltransferase
MARAIRSRACIRLGGTLHDAQRAGKGPGSAPASGRLSPPPGHASPPWAPLPDRRDGTARLGAPTRPWHENCSDLFGVRSTSLEKRNAMQQTAAHEQHNPDLLRLMPPDARAVVEVGCSSGALAREYKRTNSACRYVGIDVSPASVELARRHCDLVLGLDIEAVDEGYIRTNLSADCWVFGDSLEHLRDPWSLLERVRRTLAPQASVIACIPNAQHWSVQARLNSGALRYEDEGLLDRTHLRWFTRITIIEMFLGAGYRIDAAFPRIFAHPSTDRMIGAVRQMAASMGVDPEMAATDALPLQYVLRARPG